MSSGAEKLSRKNIDRILARDVAIGAEPRGDIFGKIRIHPDRFNFRNLPMEAKVFAKSWVHNDQPKPFLIYGRPRSGTTLLVKLLDQVPQIRCDGELLHYFLLDPVGFLRRLPMRAGPDVAAYGVKAISYHIHDVQRIHHPLAFFDRLTARGYQFIHLTRDTWGQTLSLAKAHASAVYFSSSDVRRKNLTIEPARFLELLRWNVQVIEYENKVMAHVAHLPVRYDHDLNKAAVHQQTIDGICDFIGVASGPVSAEFKRTGGSDGLHTVENMADVAHHVLKSDLAHLVPASYL